MKKARIYTNDFNRMILATKNFTGTNSKKGLHQYIRLEFDSETSIVTAIAVDGYRMSVEHAVVSACDESFVAYVRNNIKLPNKMYADLELEGGDLMIRCGEFIFGLKQPEGEFLEWEKVLPNKEATFKIGFNGNYLLDALQAAKISNGSSFKSPVILEFRSAVEPVIIRTNKNDVKMVLPIRIRD
ncbi:hypothetical protein [uncultured Dysosmobacter sp.]|uniref:hypothetical protein n=1 Tax=uncultured Dysosmobacter sp. TaxID=2591384 RepID=UPI0026396DCB|nr:hypothetical protein [uncultured Dysosmobacter sp.]